MHKKQYEQPVMNIKLFQTTDVIFTSGDIDYNPVESTDPVDPDYGWTDFY